MSRKALDKELSALLGEGAESKQAAEKLEGKNFLEIDLDLIHPNSEQPRKRLSDYDTSYRLAAKLEIIETQDVCNKRV